MQEVPQSTTRPSREPPPKDKTPRARKEDSSPTKSPQDVRAEEREYTHSEAEFSHGGRREGAGRPPIASERSVGKYLTMTGAHWRWLKRRGDGNASAAARELAERIRTLEVEENVAAMPGIVEDKCERHSVTVPPIDWNAFEEVGNGFRSTGLRRAVRWQSQRDGEPVDAITERAPEL